MVKGGASYPLRQARKEHFTMHSHHEHDPLRPHRHDPNLEVPKSGPVFIFCAPNCSKTMIDVSYMQILPLTSIANCYIVSTGHGTSGPFVFGGVQLGELTRALLPQSRAWSEVEVISVDGFGNRITRGELEEPDPAGPILLAYLLDGRELTREQGLVRMIVPSEKDDALRQVKWVGRINVI
jgi:DMSO/TMAO reductase YedYZ molybdopterin-dependent catalytic subunit